MNVKFWLFKLDVIIVSRIEFGFISGFMCMLCWCVSCIRFVLGLVIVGILVFDISFVFWLVIIGVSSVFSFDLGVLMFSLWIVIFCSGCVSGVVLFSFFSSVCVVLVCLVMK